MENLDHIVIYGGGLAGALAASALHSRLSANIALTLIETEEAGKTDLAYGTATSPSSYDFFRRIGLSEPELLLETSSAFSLGTHFKNWGPRARDWVQSFHLPLPIIKGVSFHHYVTRQHNNDKPYNLAPYIMSVQAAKAGVFAHPPEGKNIPLAAVEYGYHLSPKALTEFLLSRLPAGRVTRITAATADVNVNVSADTITSLTLNGGDKVTAGLFIDAAGPNSKMSAALGLDYASGSSGPPPRRVWMSESSEPQSKLGPPLRTLTQTEAQTGWQALTPLQGAVHILELSESKPDATSAIEVSFGRSAAPWRGNCLALGHSAAALEPLTPTPMMLLQRDIERLLELIPVSPDMSVEAREYNRRFNEDYVHAEIFHAAMTDGEDGNKNGGHHHPKLENKITQFESRGTLVQYDLEPFSPDEWAMLHYGMGRQPARYDPLADQVDTAQAAKILTQIKSANAAMALKMPPHDVYMSGLVKYLKGKYAKR